MSFIINKSHNDSRKSKDEAKSKDKIGETSLSSK